MASPSWVLGVVRAFRGRAVLVLYLPPPEGESETWRRAQRLKGSPSGPAAGRRAAVPLRKRARRLCSPPFRGPLMTVNDAKVPGGFAARGGENELVRRVRARGTRSVPIAKALSYA